MALLTRVRSTLALAARRPVLGVLEGAYASLHTGRGGDFQDLREYVPGDDVRDIDHRASARRGEPLVRRYVAERKHTVLLVVHGGRHMGAYANATDTKRDLVVTAAGMIGWLAVRHGDYVGAVVGDGAGVRAHRPVLTEVGLERLLQEVDTACAADDHAQGLAELLAYAASALRRRSILVVLTDTAPLGEREAALLRRLRAQHEVLMVTVTDLNPALPTATPVVDVDRGRPLPAFVARAQLAREVARLDARDRDARRALLATTGVVGVELAALDEAVAAVSLLLQRSRHAH